MKPRPETTHAKGSPGGTFPALATLLICHGTVKPSAWLVSTLPLCDSTTLRLCHRCRALWTHRSERASPRHTRNCTDVTGKYACFSECLYTTQQHGITFVTIHASHSVSTSQASHLEQGVSIAHSLFRSTPPRGGGQDASSFDYERTLHQRHDGRARIFDHRGQLSCYSPTLANIASLA